MKVLFRVGVFLVVLLFFSVTLFHCGGGALPGGYVGTSPPHLLHVTNGSVLGFYTATGAYGFSTQSRSIFYFPGTYSSYQPLAQNPNSGYFYFSTGNNSDGENGVYYFNGTTGGYFKGAAGGSEMILQSPGVSLGVAVSTLTNYIYVADSENDVVTFLAGASVNYAIKSGSIFSGPINAVPQYVAVSGSVVAVTEKYYGSVFFLNATSGATINPSGSNPYLSIVSGSGPCTSASLVSKIQTNGNGGMYVACGSGIIYLSVAGTPNYLNSSLATSTFPVAGVTVTDVVYDKNSGNIGVVGGSIVTTLNGVTGAIIENADLSTYGCGSGITLSGITYSPDKDVFFVSDSTNSTIYVLNPSTLAMSTGACGTSTFSTATDVPNPGSLGYF